MSIKIGIKDYKQVIKQLDKMKDAPKKALEATEADIKKRAPGWIASGVVERYNLEGAKGAGKKAILSGKVGELEIDGSLQNKTLHLKYSGRLLTPTHFGMSPTTKPASGKQYTLKWKVKRTDGKPFKSHVKKLTKKQKSALAKNFTASGSQNSPRSPWMLQPTGAKSADKVQYIPFQRRGQTEPFNHVAKTLSLPQMIRKGKDGPLHPEVAAHFYENLEKRVTHNLNRYMGKK